MIILAIIKNSTLRERIKPGTVIKVFGRIGVVYSDGDDGMIRLNCMNHEIFAFRPSIMNSPVKYEVVKDPPPTIMNGNKWDFVDNVVS